MFGKRERPIDAIEVLKHTSFSLLLGLLVTGCTSGSSSNENQDDQSVDQREVRINRGPNRAPNIVPIPDSAIRQTTINPQEVSNYPITNGKFEGQFPKLLGYPRVLNNGGVLFQNSISPGSSFYYLAPGRKTLTEITARFSPLIDAKSVVVDGQSFVVFFKESIQQISNAPLSLEVHNAQTGEFTSVPVDGITSCRSYSLSSRAGSIILLCSIINRDDSKVIQSFEYNVSTRSLTTLRETRFGPFNSPYTEQLTRQNAFEFDASAGQNNTTLFNPSGFGIVVEPGKSEGALFFSATRILNDKPSGTATRIAAAGATRTSLITITGSARTTGQTNVALTPIIRAKMGIRLAQDPENNYTRPTLNVDYNSIQLELVSNLQSLENSGVDNFSMLYRGDVLLWRYNPNGADLTNRDGTSAAKGNIEQVAISELVSPRVFNPEAEIITAYWLEKDRIILTVQPKNPGVTDSFRIVRLPTGQVLRAFDAR